MNFKEKGIIIGSQVGFLDLTTELVETLICTDPITDHFEVEMTPFARGKFATVRRVRCLRTGECYAAKVVRRRRRARDIRYETVHEAAVLSLARENSKIVKLHKVFEEPTEITLILELASGGELQRVIDEEERIEERVVRRYLTHILTALRFLHSHSIAHLDLKPQNLLLTGPHPSSDVKLCDFGLSRLILEDIEVRELLGTPDYVAPEILQYEPISLATDMWSVGVLSYVLLTGHSPFGGDTKQETSMNITQCQLDFPDEIFSGVSSTAKEFIGKLLVVEPGCRLTVDEALSHPWLASFSICNSTSSVTTSSTPSVVKEDTESTSNSSSVHLKRSSSPPKAIASNKENDRNLLNSSLSSGGSSPPSKRECREAKEGEAMPLCSPESSPQSSRPPKSQLSSPRTPPKDRGRVSRQIKNIEMKIRRSPSCREERDTNDSAPSVANLKAKFTNQISLNISAISSEGRECHDDAKDTAPQGQGLSPLCVRRDQNQKPQGGTRRDFQDIVIRNGYIY